MKEFGFEPVPNSEVQFDPEALRQTTINRAMRAAEKVYGAGKLAFAGEVTDDQGNLESIVFIDSEQKGVDLPGKVVRMKKTADGQWESDEMIPD